MRELQHRGADGATVAAGINAFLFPGCGFGGSCLPKDIASLSAWAVARGHPARVLDAALAVNRARPLHLVDVAEAALGSLDRKRIALLGLAFKPGTDDVRDSPALPIARELARRGAQVDAYDPMAGSAGAAALAGTPGIAVRASLGAALEGTDAAILATRWEEFRAVPALLASRAPLPLLVDGRRMLDPRSYPRYVGIGLAPAAGDPAE
jgi:UDPglucose 6-dehydrogenase/GDP-mannose 6-dehydrogenase